jgi:hypothetical protein
MKVGIGMIDWKEDLAELQHAPLLIKRHCCAANAYLLQASLDLSGDVR